MSSYDSKSHGAGPSVGSERQVVDQVTRHLMCFLFLLFVVSFLDRIHIGFAGLAMMKDLGLATPLFYVACIACGIPSHIVLARTSRPAA